MSENESVGTQDVNPFDSDNFNSGGGLWDGKLVTITASYTAVEDLVYKDGTPVIDANTKQPARQVAWVLKGVSEDSEKERKEVYSTGDKVKPTADGKGFVMVDGSPLKFHANSNVAKLAAALKASGYPLGKLYVDGKQDVGVLVGAKLRFAGVAKVGKDGKVIKDKKGYTKQGFFPTEYIGGGGQVASTGAKAGNGAGGASDKAAGLVLAALAEGPQTRTDLVRKVNAAMAGQADLFDVVKLIADDGWHKGKPWKFDGLQASL